MNFLFTDWNEAEVQQAVERVSHQSIKLRPYQEEAVASVFREWELHKSTMVNLATGMGKSVIFAEVMRRWDVPTMGKVMLIAHRKELIYQAVGHAKRAGLSSGIEMAHQHAIGNEDVVIASVQSLNASRKCDQCFGEGCDDCHDGKVKRFTRFNPRTYGLIVCDEFHHFTARSNRNVLTWFGQNTNQKTLGVTATPKRSDKIGLHNVCDSVAYRMDLREAIDEGWLVPVRQKLVTVDGLDISKVTVRQGKLDEGQVEAAFLGTEADEEEMLHAIVKPTLLEATGRKTLVFAAGQDHAKKLAASFAAHGVDAGVVIDSTEHRERAELVEAFNNGDMQVLVNCMCFTEGFDAPATAVIANCRKIGPNSVGLLLQIIGRSTRPLPGVVDGPLTAEARRAAIAASEKPFATILDFVGNSGDIKLLTVADVLAGDRVDPLDLKEALEIATRDGETHDIDELIEKAKQSRAEAAERKERERRQRLMTNTKADRADYSAVDVDLFSGERFDFRGDVVELATAKQKRFLRSQGIEKKKVDVMTKRQAGAIISATYKTVETDWRTLMGEAASVQELRRVGEQISKRLKSDYVLERVADKLRGAWRERRDELKRAEEAKQNA